MSYFYPYQKSGTTFYFETDFSDWYAVDVSLAQAFTSDSPFPFYSEKIYWVSFKGEPGGKKLRVDPKAHLTIQYIVESWMQENNKILFFVCSNERGHGFTRMKKFKNWAKLHKEQYRMDSFQNEDPIKGTTYSGFIIRLDNPNLTDYQQDIAQIGPYLEKEKGREIPQ